MTDAQPLPALVSTTWLADRLGQPDIRIIDATTNIKMADGNRPELTPSRQAFETAHIPGAVYLDLARELSDTSSGLTLMAPSKEQFASALEKLGITENTHVIAYSSGEPWWATRLWWIFRQLGFENVSVLDGGLSKWQADGFATQSGPGAVSVASAPAFAPRTVGIATASDITAALADPTAHVVSARLPSHFLGIDGNSYGRPGRIPGSINVPAASLYNADGTFLPLSQLKAIFADAGIEQDSRVITYCGYGIAASAVTFALFLTGLSDAALYDGSLEDWAKDPSLPMVTG